MLKQLLVPIPAEIEQMEIAVALESFEQKIFVSRQKMNSLADLFRTLLHQLMTAEIRVGDLELPELGLDTEDKEAYRR